MPRGVRAVVLVVVAIAVIAGVVRIAGFAFGPPAVHFRNFGTVETRFGIALVSCGGDTAPRCGDATALAF